MLFRSCLISAAFLAGSALAKGPETQPAGVVKPVDDKTFVADAASGGMMEVALGKYAVEHGVSDEVKKFGNRMVADHSKANDELAKIAQDKGIAVPKEMSAGDQKMYDMLTKLQGADFDKQYMHHMVMDHNKDLTEFKGEATIGKVKEMVVPRPSPGDWARMRP